MEYQTVLELTKPEAIMLRELLENASVTVRAAAVAASLNRKVQEAAEDFPPADKAG